MPPEVVLHCHLSHDTKKYCMFSYSSNHHQKFVHLLTYI
uniref:Uncharacterized protein n=1 Tax=Arundo donax TaxID=35708 RepID=A0A0A9AVG9_ARUDO